MPDLSRFTIIKKRLQPLSLAIQLKDKLVTNFTPVGKVEVSLKNSEHKNSRSLSGAFAYLALRDGVYRVQIESDFYLRKEFNVTLPTHTTPPGGELPLDDDVILIDLKNALAAEVKLYPEVNYPFPSGATVVQSVVLDAQGKPLPGATIEIFDRNLVPPEKKIAFPTNPQGRFALCFNRMSRDRLVEINGKNYDGSKKLRLRATHPDRGNSLPLALEVRSRKTNEADDPQVIYEGETNFKKILY